MCYIVQMRCCVCCVHVHEILDGRLCVRDVDGWLLGIAEMFMGDCLKLLHLTIQHPFLSPFGGDTHTHTHNITHTHIQTQTLGGSCWMGY